MTAELEEQIASLRTLVEAQAEELGRMRSTVARLEERAQPESAPPRSRSHPDEAPLSRRRLLGKAGAAAAAGAAGIAIAAHPAAAATGDELLVGNRNNADRGTWLETATSTPGSEVCFGVHGGFTPFNSNLYKAVILGYAGPAHADRPALRGYSTHSNAVYGEALRYVAVVGVSRDDAGVVGDSTKSAGVIGKSTESHGVWGFSRAAGNAGVYGTTTSGVGTFGNASAAGTGALGISQSGDGVRAVSTSGTGCRASSTSGTAVRAVAFTGSAVTASATSGNTILSTSTDGVALSATSSNWVGVSGYGGTYGGSFQGRTAALRLAPQLTAGKPTTGKHQRGELLCDKNGVLWFCTANGTPGTWKRVQLV